MVFILILLALSFPAIEGMMALRVIEGDNPVLFAIERWCAGFLIGCAISAFIIFWAVFFGAPLAFSGFLAGHLAIIAVLLALGFRLSTFHFHAGRGRIARFSDTPARRSSKSPKTPLMKKFKTGMRAGALKIADFLRPAGKKHVLLRALIFWMAIWTVIKIAGGGYDIFNVPSYWDDNYSNWNMRARVMYEERSLMLDLPSDNPLYFGGRAAGYPLTAYFTKIWIAQFTEQLCPAPSLCSGAGFTDQAVNSISFFWFAAFLAVFFCSLYRAFNNHISNGKSALVWAIVGVWLLVSLPLYLVHGTNPYVDVYMSASVFIVIYWFWEWAKRLQNGKPHPGAADADVWLRLAALAIAAMLFVKNEALLIFFPPLALIFLWICGRNIKNALQRARSIAIAAIPAAATAVPWILFKFTHELGFANNKSVGGVLSLTAHAGVPLAIFNDIFYTGSFMILFPIFLVLLAITWNTWRQSALMPVVVFVFTVFAGEFAIYWFTDLATEALRHTGFGRGMVQIVPIVVFVSVILVRGLFENETAARKSHHHSGRSLTANRS